MRINTMCVRRLKTTGPYENVAIELCAEVSLNDDLDAVYEALLTKISEFIELLPGIERAAKYLEEVERRRAELERAVLEMERSLNELRSVYSAVSSTLSELRSVVEQAGRLVEEARKRKSLLEMLGLRR